MIRSTISLLLAGALLLGANTPAAYGAPLPGRSQQAGISAIEQRPVTARANAKTAMLLQFLSALEYRSSDRFMTGQFVAPNYGRPERSTAAIPLTTVQDCWNYHIGRLQTATGKAPALVGFDLSNRRFQQSGAGTPAANMPGDENILGPSKAHAANGGIVTLSWHASNPWTSESSWSRIPTGRRLSEVYTPGTAANAQYMQWLTKVGDILQHYSDAGIPVIWRPFHEMNGSAFWWAYQPNNAGSADQYVALWKHMYSYLTTTRGLTNLLWAWSPNSGTAFGSGITARYPGDAYVDILGHERYTNALTDTARYDWMSARNKVILFTEAGQEVTNAGPWDATQMLREVRGSYPKVVGGMNWMRTTVDFSIVGNMPASSPSGAFMNDPISLTLDEMPGNIADNAGAGITYSGTWTHSGDIRYLSGTKSVASAAGARATFAFTGSRVSVWGKKLVTKAGRFDLYVDGVLKQAGVSTAAPADAFGVKLAEVTGLTSGPHTAELRLTSTGGYVGFDFFGTR